MLTVAQLVKILKEKMDEGVVNSKTEVVISIKECELPTGECAFFNFPIVEIAGSSTMEKENTIYLFIDETIQEVCEMYKEESK